MGYGRRRGGLNPPQNDDSQAIEEVHATDAGTPEKIKSRQMPGTPLVIRGALDSEGGHCKAQLPSVCATGSLLRQAASLCVINRAPCLRRRVARVRQHDALGAAGASAEGAGA